MIRVRRLVFHHSIPEKRDRDTFIMPNAVLYRCNVFFAVQQGFPRVEVACLVKIAVGDIRIFFQADHIENVVPVRDLPGIWYD